MMNRRGPSIEPWRTPWDRGAVVDADELLVVSEM